MLSRENWGKLVLLVSFGLLLAAFAMGVVW